MILLNEKSELKNISNFFIFSDKNVFLKKSLLPGIDDFCSVLDLYDEKLDFIVEPEQNYSSVILPSLEGDVFKDFSKVPIRQYFFYHSEFENALISRAYSLWKWNDSMKFCSRCSSILRFSQKNSSKICPECKSEYFPRIEPCIIVLVSKGDEILLVKHTYRNQDIFACIAGFIEVGESCEHAVAREVFEEVGIKIKNIRYAGSQSWPFPDQLMLAFYAEYESGDFNLQQEEIAEAHWFSKDNIPSSPREGSVAYRLIHGLF